MEAVIKRQECVLAEGHDERLLCNRKTLDFGARVPILPSAAELRLGDLATVFGLMP
jgi:hypothetical protein